MSIDLNKILLLKYDDKKGVWQDESSQISNYEIEPNIYRVQYISNSRYYSISYRKIRILENPQNVDVTNVEVFHNGVALINIRYVLKFDDWYRVFYENGKSKAYKSDDISFIKNEHDEPGVKKFLDYLFEVAKYISVEEGTDYLANQLSSLFVNKESILSKFINKTLSRQDFKEDLIFPFSTNASQQKAVLAAMEEDLSLIQGPPGTGKTQTILNIIANMIVQGKSVAVVSGNNEATKNVLEKIESAGYGYINAFLGKHENVSKFFKNNKEEITLNSHTTQLNDNITSSATLLKECYKKKLKRAENSQLISEFETEKAINDAEYYLKNHDVPETILRKNYTSQKLLELSSILQCINETKYMSFFMRVRFLFRFGIIYSKQLTENLYDIIEYIESKYYVTKISELNKENNKIDDFLRKNNFENILMEYKKYSAVMLENALNDRYKRPFCDFTESNYRYRFCEFVRRYPVIYSTTHAIVSCTGKHYLYDCIIIDESSQVDIVTAAIAFSCAKKVVLVGDVKQLSHVVKSQHIDVLNKIFKSTGLDDCYNYVYNNILCCVEKSLPLVKNTLLREHYRCDPEIIGFCNKRFYDGNLVAVKKHKIGCGVEIISHPSHVASGRINERQVEIIKRELMSRLNLSKTGIVAPYRDQVSLLQQSFKDSGMLVDTVHKFQGKECDTVIMSTVSNRVVFYEDEERIDFLNKPNLINVAISRAIDKLYILASHEVLEQEGSILRDLSKYCEYYCSETKILQTSVYSVFDLMFDDYSPVLEEIKKRLLNISLFDSENIIATVIQDICESGVCGAISYKFNYPLRAVIKVSALRDYDDIKFVRNINTHCDFVIFNKLDKRIELIVEVDGAQHQEIIQADRDKRKDRLLENAGIKVLRLKTKEHDCKEKIIAALKSE